MAANNVHQNIGRVQEGGTGMVAFGESTGYITKTGKDPSGLGRWCWTLYGGSNGHNTRVVVAYNACKNKKKDSRTTYQQQRQYFITKKNDLTCPSKLFRQHLVQQLKQWQSKGDRIILFMDHNEHTYNGPLGRVLMNMEGLGLQEAVLCHTGKRTGATFFRGSKPIDGLWVTSNLDIANVCVMPFGYGIRDHRMFVLDITMESLVGKNPTKAVRPASRQLNSKLPRCGKAYNKSLESNIVQHRLLERLSEAHRSNLATNKKIEVINNIDWEGRDYMKHTEKWCRKIKCCRISYSPELAIQIRRAQVYYSIIRWHEGKIQNKGNLKRADRRCNIQNPLGMSMAEVLLRVEECKRECKFYQEHGRRFQNKHLAEWMRLAQERNNVEAFKKIEDIITREKQRSFWRRLNFITGKK